MPDYIYAPVEPTERKRQTNARYRFYRQAHFTAGDLDQMLQYWDTTSGSTSDGKQEENRIDDYQHVNSALYTFHYLFYYLKKGIFVRIVDNRVRVFLPFANADYENDWHAHIKHDPKLYVSMTDLFQDVCRRSGHEFVTNRVNHDRRTWHANNGLIRYEYPPLDGDSGVNMLKNMLDELCAQRNVADVDFFLNKRDFPLLRADGIAPYEVLYPEEKPIEAHRARWWFYSSSVPPGVQFLPILSMTTTEHHSDVAIPTWDDWCRASFQDDQRIFRRECRRYPVIQLTPWGHKIPTAVFRGASTGLGTTYETNPRLMFTKLSMEGKCHAGGCPYLDVAITKWNLRPRQCARDGCFSTISDTIVAKLGQKNPLTLQEQSRFKYILNLPGHSCAYRLSYELSSGSVILLYPSPYRLWFTHMLKPYVHYVPLEANDPADVFRKIDWCIANDLQCQQIVKNALQFYHQHLSKDAILDHLVATLDGVRATHPPRYQTRSLFDAQMTWQMKRLRVANTHQREWLDKNAPLRDMLNQTLLDPTLSARTITEWLSRYRQNLLWSWSLQGVWDLAALVMDDPPEANSARGTIPESSIEFIQWCNQSVVLKRPQSARMHERDACARRQKWQEWIHEICVRRFFINPLACRLPHFSVMIRHSSPCSEASPESQYMLLTTVPGICVDAWIRQTLVSDGATRLVRYLRVLQQACLSLHVAQSLCGFIHFDLYPWNCMITPLTDSMQVSYGRSCKPFQVQSWTHDLFVMIDFGRSMVLHQQRVHHHISPFCPHVLHDVITLLVSSLNVILESWQLTTKETETIFQVLRYIDSWTPLGEAEPVTRISQLKAFLRTHKKFGNMLKPKHGLTEHQTLLGMCCHLETCICASTHHNRARSKRSLRVTTLDCMAQTPLSESLRRLSMCEMRDMDTMFLSTVGTLLLCAHTNQSINMQVPTSPFPFLEWSTMIKTDKSIESWPHAGLVRSVQDDPIYMHVASLAQTIVFGTRPLGKVVVRIESGPSLLSAPVFFSHVDEPALRRMVSSVVMSDVRMTLDAHANAQWQLLELGGGCDNALSVEKVLLLCFVHTVSAFLTDDDDAKASDPTAQCTSPPLV